MSYSVIGSCSICGGDVVLPMVWFGIYPPAPTCRSCGAVENKPTIQMKPSPKVVTTDKIKIFLEEYRGENDH